MSHIDDVLQAHPEEIIHWASLHLFGSHYLLQS